MSTWAGVQSGVVSALWYRLLPYGLSGVDVWGLKHMTGESFVGILMPATWLFITLFVDNFIGAYFISLPSAFTIKGDTNQTKLQQQAGNSPPSTNDLGLSSHQSAHLGKFLILCHSYVTLMHQFLQQQLLNLISWHHHTLVPPAELAEWEQMFVILVVAK